MKKSGVLKIEISFEIRDVIAFLAAGVALLTLINLSRNIDIIQNHHLKSLEVNKNQYSFNIVAEAHNDSIANSLAVFRKIRKEHKLPEINTQNFLKILDENPDYEREILRLFNYFEHMCMLIRKEHVDEEIIKDSFKTLFIKSYSLMKFYIEYIQIDSHTIYSEFVDTVKRWEQA